MYSYRITKYNPVFGNEFGYYDRSEWTSISDIGKSFDGIILSFDEYYISENKLFICYKIYCKIEQYQDI